MNVKEIFKDGVEFSEKTLDGNFIRGLINKKSNRNMGSLLITSINHKDVEQYVQGFPKIHYWDKGHQLNNSICGFEKYDGSCICIYPLKNKDEEIIELVPKSRGLPILDKNLQSMYNLVEKSKIKSFFNVPYNKNSQLFFELYGIKNLHTIYHMDTYIDLALIGGVKDISLQGNEVYRTFFNGVDVLNYQYIYEFNTPPFLFSIESSLSSNEKHLVLKSDFIKKYMPYFDNKKVLYTLPTIYDCILKIREILETVNSNYKKENHRIATEGVVLNGLFDDFQTYIKVKPDTIETEVRTQNGVPRKFILKEVNKYLDEYGSTAKETYINNPDEIWKYVSNNLLEEFTPDVVNDSKTQKRIKKVFVQVADSKEVPESINNIAHELVEKYPNESVQNLMRIFSQEYPYKKKDARLIYGILEKIVK